MAEQDFCHTCIHKHSCQTVYQHLGNTEGPSVGAKVSFAFLLPLIVFIVSLAISERLVAGAVSSTAAQTAVSLLLALGVTLACIVITKIATKRAGHDR
jgi:uncharacterized membrane protein (DUF485 family)